MHQPQITILDFPRQSSHQNQTNPIQLVQQKNYFLSSLADRITTENRLPALDCKRNIKVDHYMNKYTELVKQQKKVTTLNKAYLQSNDFQSIFAETEAERSQKHKEQKQTQIMRKQLYQEFIENKKESFDLAEGERDHLQNPSYTVLSNYRQDQTRMKELHLIDLEIAKFRRESEIERMHLRNSNTCTNHQLVSKLSCNIVSSYIVHFDQIYDRLIDELLEEEVIYFNSLEAQLHLEYQLQPQENLQTAKGKRLPKNSEHTLSMMELVKGLDDLAQ